MYVVRVGSLLAKGTTSITIGEFTLEKGLNECVERGKLFSTEANRIQHHRVHTGRGLTCAGNVGTAFLTDPVSLIT